MEYPDWGNIVFAELKNNRGSVFLLGSELRATRNSML